MSCKCAKFDPEEGRYSCSVSGDGCVFMIPDSKSCAEMYGEGPDVPMTDEEKDKMVTSYLFYKNCLISVTKKYLFIESNDCDKDILFKTEDQSWFDVFRTIQIENQFDFDGDVVRELIKSPAQKTLDDKLDELLSKEVNKEMDENH